MSSYVNAGFHLTLKNKLYTDGAQCTFNAYIS